MGGDRARGKVLNHQGMNRETKPDERLRGHPEEFRVQDRTSTFAGIRVSFYFCLRGILGRGEVLVFLSVPVPTVD